MYRSTVQGLEGRDIPRPPPLVRHGHMQPQQLPQPMSQCQFASMSAAPSYVQQQSALQQSSPYVQPTTGHQATSMYSQQMPSLQRLPSHVQPAPASMAQHPFANASSLAQRASNPPNLYSEKTYKLPSLPGQQSCTGQNHIPGHQTYQVQRFPGQQTMTHPMPNTSVRSVSPQFVSCQLIGINRMDTAYGRTSVGVVEQQTIPHSVPRNSPVFSNIQNPFRMPTTVTAAQEQIPPLPAHQQKASSLMTPYISLTELQEQLAARSTIQQFGNTGSSYQHLSKNTSDGVSTFPGLNNNVSLQGVRPGYSGVRSTLSAQDHRISSGISTLRHSVAQPMLGVNFQGNEGVQSQGQLPRFHQNRQSQGFVHHGSRPSSQDPTLNHFSSKAMLSGQNMGHSSHNPQFQGQMEHLIPSSTISVDNRDRLEANVHKHSGDIVQQMGSSEKTIAYLRHQSNLQNLSQMYKTHGSIVSQTSAIAQGHSSTQVCSTSQSNDFSAVKLSGLKHQSLPQDVALIQSAFAIPQSSESTESHTRWYAHPSSTQPAVLQEQRDSGNYSPHSIDDIMKCSEAPNLSISGSQPCTQNVSSPLGQSSSAINSVSTETTSADSSSGAEIAAVDLLLGFNTNDNEECDKSKLYIPLLQHNALREAESILDLNKKKVIDELVLNSQCNYEDIDIIRTYLPSPECPPDFEPPEASINEEHHVSCSDSNDLQVETVEESNDTNDLQVPVLQPAVEMHEDENHSSNKQIGEKRKHDSTADDKTTLFYSPPVKLARGRERKIGFGKGCGKNWKSKGGRSLSRDGKSLVRQAGKSPIGRGSTKGRLWAVKGYSDIRKKNTISKRKQSATNSRGRGRGKKQKSEQVESQDCKTSATITKIGGQVIKKPDELRALMDTFDNDELERHAVPLSTIKLLFDHWSQNMATKDQSGSGRDGSNVKDESKGEIVDCNNDNSAELKSNGENINCNNENDAKDKSKDETIDNTNENSAKEKSNGEIIDCNNESGAEDKSKDETIDFNNDNCALDKSGGEATDGFNEKSAESVFKDASEARMSADVKVSGGVDEHDSTSALQNNDSSDSTKTLQTKRRNHLESKKSHAHGNKELTDQSDHHIRMDKDTSALNAKGKIKKHKDKKDYTRIKRQAHEQEDHITDGDSNEASVNQLNYAVKNVSAQTYSLTDDHKMTWVRFHGKIVTRLISPDGPFFILKEILRRCFRIKEPNKRVKYKKIGITKKEILKIPDVKMESVFFDFVVKSLKDRDIIRTVPDHFELISEDNANRLFHHVCGESYCKGGCIAPYLKSVSSVPKNKSQGHKSGSGDNVDNDRNVFEIVQEEMKSVAVKLKLRKKRSYVESEENEVIDLCSDESDGYDTDRTCPYVDGQPNCDFKESEKQSNEHYQNSDRNIKGSDMMSGSDVTIDEDKVTEDSADHESTSGNICNGDKDICKKTFDKLKKQLSTIVHSDEEASKKKEDIVIVEDDGPDSSVQTSIQQSTCVSHADITDSSNLSENEMNIQNDATTSNNVSSTSGQETSDSRIDARLDIEDAGIDTLENVIVKDHNADVVEACEEDDDVIVYGCTFPGPPKTYPEGGTQKLSEAHDTLMEIIEQANNAQTNEEMSVILDKVFCISKPLKKWTCSLFDSYESVLLTEAERTKQLADVSESSEVETGAGDVGDICS